MTQQHGVAGIDPHKHTATVAVLDQRGGVLDCRSFAISSEGITELLAFLLATEVTFDRIGVEGSGFLGQPLVLALSAAGYDVPNPAWQTLTAIRNWRESLVLQRVRLLTEAEAVLVTLPVAVRSTLPTTSRVLPQLKALHNEDVTITGAAELSPADRIKLDRLAASLADITTLTERISELDKQIPPVLDELGCSLTQVYGVGRVTAMELLVEVGDPLRFGTEARFARWCGAAPVAISSGEGNAQPHRHRLDLGGNRAVNSILHTIHVTQIRCYQPAQQYMTSKTERKSKRDARRSHKRHLANVIIRHMWRDAHGARAAHYRLPDAA